MRRGLVLLPGLDGSGKLQGDFIAALGPNFAVTPVAYPPDRPLGYAALEDVVRPRLPRDEPFLILAEPFSVPLAVALAAAQPKGLLGLVLVASFVRSPRPALAPFAGLARLIPFHARPAIALIANQLLGRWNSPGSRRRLAEALRPVSPKVLAARLAELVRTDVSTRLAEVTVPLLYLQATDDRLVPPAAGQLIARLAPQAQIARIEGPHALLQAAPQACADAVVAFARRPPT